MRIEQLEERALDELGLDADALVAEYGPDQPVPSTAEVAEGEEQPPPSPYDREEQSKRLRTAERALAQLGRINPLALEEFSALEERHKFLTEQLEDLKSTRKDLLDIVQRGRRPRAAGLHRGVRRRRAPPSTRRSPGCSPEARDASC